MAHDYWDMTEPARAALTEDDVRACEAYELMRAGVVRVPPPLPLESRMPVELSAFYRVTIAGRYGRDTLNEVLFDDPVDARKWIESNPITARAEYFDGTTVITCAHVADMAPEVVMVEATWRERFDAHRAAMEKYAAAKKKHDAERAAYEKSATAARKATEGLWVDWYRCREQERECRRVVDTFTEYTQLAGSEQLAATFLLKAFTREQVRDACGWFGVSIPLPDETVEGEKITTPATTSEAF